MATRTLEHHDEEDDDSGEDASGEQASMHRIRPATHVIHAMRLAVDEPEDEEHTDERDGARMWSVSRHEDGQPEGEDRHEHKEPPHLSWSIDSARFFIQIATGVYLKESKSIPLSEI